MWDRGCAPMPRAAGRNLTRGQMSWHDVPPNRKAAVNTMRDLPKTG